ncbi:MAG: iron-containing alcohol dehydrogenase [Candidatus Omnitrophica bacterium]|nr:iron-containing alcohol dehydrogenase [Candidatus Omnitrophota bacterium]
MPLNPPVFNFHQPVRLIFGEGSFSRIGEVVRSVHGSHALIITDPGILEAGFPQLAGQILSDQGMRVSFFSEVIENPTTETVAACAAVARSERIDTLIGLGGGSSIDTAKGCNFILTNGGRIEDYCGYGKATHPFLPMIAIPTTAGTGSECQSYALISDAATHRKMACGDPRAIPSAAILDPCLTVTQPPLVTACTGIDAIAHAVESFVTQRRTPLSSLFAREAFHLMAESFGQVLHEPNHLEARGRVLLGAAYAGIAIENSMLGAAHAAANPLTARYGITHGQAVGVMLPEVVRYNAMEAHAGELYLQLIEESGINGGSLQDKGNPGECLAAWLETILAQGGLPGNMRDLGVQADDLPQLAQMAAEQWTGTFNPRPMNAELFRQLYEQVMEKS